MNEKEIWTEFAHSYTRVLSNWSQYQELVDKVLHHMKDQHYILDQGCGTGIFSFALADNGKEVVGVDTNPYMLAEAQRTLDDYVGAGTLHFEEGDAQHLSFDDKTFDGVVSNNVIFNVEDPDKLLSEAYRVLRKGGILTISGPQQLTNITLFQDHIVEEFKRKNVYEELAPYVTHFFECSTNLRSEGMPNVYAPQEMSALLGGHGFQPPLEVGGDVYLKQSFFVAAKK